MNSSSKYNILNRTDYTLSELHEQSLDENPFIQFNHWLQEAEKCDSIMEPNAMALATATPDGIPSLRTVLLRHMDEHGFVFFTNYNSKKGKELQVNPKAALLFWWPELQRQIRIEGIVQRISPEDSNAYFKSRPFLSRIAAVISDQSQVLPNKEFLQTQFDLEKSKYNDEHPESDIPRPNNWGGYCLNPTLFEFWQGGRNRLHDRLRYRCLSEQCNTTWIIDRLYP